MASRRNNATPPVGMPQLGPQEALNVLSEHADAGAKLVESRGPMAAIDVWEREVKHLLEASFGSGSSKIDDVQGAGIPYMLTSDMPQSAIDQQSRENFQSKVRALQAIVTVMKKTTPPTPAPPAVETARANASGRSVFIVHGHDDSTRNAVAHFIGLLHLKPVILHEQASGGRTLLEKFEDHAGEAAFAVVLLTPDDIGGVEATALKPRARQNVVFELGFFFGKLGRGRVCALYTPDVELPSDLAGLVYVKLDGTDSWQLALAKEIKRAIPEVNLNLIME